MICTEVGIWGDTTDPSHLELQASYVPPVNARGLAAGLESVVWYPLISQFYSPARDRPPARAALI